MKRLLKGIVALFLGIITFFLSSKVYTKVDTKNTKKVSKELKKKEDYWRGLNKGDTVAAFKKSIRRNVK